MGYIAGWGVHHADSAVQGSGLDEYPGLVTIDARGRFPNTDLFDNPNGWQMHITFEGSQGWVFIWRGTVDAHPMSSLDVRIGPRDVVSGQQ